jgi:hypothetical protein
MNFTRDELANLDMALRGHIESVGHRIATDKNLRGPAEQDAMAHYRDLVRLRDKVVRYISETLTGA